MSYNYRCKKRHKGIQCDTRRTLRQKVEYYTNKPRCLSCGSELSYYDKSRKKWTKKNKCLCDGIHYPHTKGSKWCIQYKGVLTDEDYEDRYKI